HWAPGGAKTEGPGGLHLTPRQRDVLNLMAGGKSNKEIARILGLAEGTIKLHVTGLLKVLDANNRTQAVIKAASLGLTQGLEQD
ncbi:MAG TPA: DNA-binding response regulator, partial [Rhodospirillaceae bacterium]|nr:DNA-binding response regulator [Rhodospirillaceae bacterium]